MNNNLDATLVLADLPTDLAWKFGGFTNGLEPLTLPQPRSPDGADGYGRPGATDEDAYGSVCRLIQLAGAAGSPLGPDGHCQPESELYWFRWITGHQVSFISWRLMAQLIADAVSGRLTVEAALAGLCPCIRVYTAMLLYTGSCPRGTYHEVIRPSMRLRHPSFSGSWAPDYWPVRSLLRGGRLPFTLSAGSGDVLRAVALHQLVHDGIAAKLVPDGRSLLRQSGVRGLDLKLLHVIYDNYFLTLRAPVSRHEVIAQLLRRLVAIAQDVAANGLHPAPDENSGELPEELQTSEVASCEENFIDILYEAANCATCLPAGELLASAAGNGALRHSR
ncbi:MAG: hypothetical protein ACM3ML_34670 [Micromonosporaceae bacterium]